MINPIRIELKRDGSGESRASNALLRSSMLPGSKVQLKVKTVLRVYL